MADDILKATNASDWKNATDWKNLSRSVSGGEETGEEGIKASDIFIMNVVVPFTVVFVAFIAICLLVLLCRDPPHRRQRLAQSEAEFEEEEESDDEEDLDVVGAPTTTTKKSIAKNPVIETNADDDDPQDYADVLSEIELTSLPEK